MRAAIVAGIFTLVGAIAGVTLDRIIERRTLDEVWRKDLAMRLLQRSTGRWFRAKTVVMAADSSVFRKRWDDYVDRGVTQWNEEYFVLEHGINNFFPGARDEFAALQERFRRLHEALLVYHRHGGRPPVAARRSAETTLNQAEVDLRAFVAVILDGQ